MELELILTGLWPFKLSHFWQPWQLFCTVRYGVCVINSSWMFRNFCRHIVNLLKMSLWVFDGARINFDRISTFKTQLLWQLFCTLGFNQLLLQLLKNSFHTLLTCWCTMEICIWLCNVVKMYFDIYGHLNLVILSSSPYYRIRPAKSHAIRV